MSAPSKNVAFCAAVSADADGQSVANGFDLLARPYRWLEYLTFGPLLQNCRTQFLAQGSECRHALVLGDGDGRFTARLLRANPQIVVHAVDGSAEMLRSLESRARPHQDRLTTEQADLRVWTPPAGHHYDLITSHFFLDCVTTREVAGLAARIAPFAAHDALWLVSDFALPPTRYGRVVGKPLIALLYRAFRLLTRLEVQSLPDHVSALSAAGWSLANQKSQLNGLLTSQMWQRSAACIPSSRRFV